MKRGLVVLVVLFVGVLALSPVAWGQELIKNGGFEDAVMIPFPSGPYYMSGGQSGALWSVTDVDNSTYAGNKAGIGPSPSMDPAYIASGSAAASVSAFSDYGILSQHVDTLTPNTLYQLSFDILPLRESFALTNYFKTSIDATDLGTLEDFGDVNNPQYQTVSYNFTTGATQTSADVTFTYKTEWFMYLDNVSLMVPVPEPSTIIGLASIGLMGATSFWWRRRQRRNETAK